MRFRSAGGRGTLTVGQAGSTFALAAEQPQAFPWALEVRAAFAGGFQRVGRLLLPAAIARGRLVCVASVPGARDWAVEVVPLVTGGTAHVDLTATVEKCCGPAPFRVLGAAYPWDALSVVSAGVSGGPFGIAAEDRVTHWSAHAPAAGPAGSVAISFADGSNDTVPVPPGATVEGWPSPDGIGPLSFLFTGTDSYLIESERYRLP